MDLKEQLRADVAAVFLNRAEFAVTVRLGDVEVPGIWSDSAQTYQDYHHEELPHLPLDVGERILEIAEGVVAVLPGQEIEVDGRVWILRKSAAWHGLVLLQLYSNEVF